MKNESLPAPPRQDDGPVAPLPRISDRLNRLDQIIAEAEAAFGSLDPNGRRVRSDGWTPERIRAFLHKLADCGIVADAARAAGMTPRSAQALRLRAEGRAFDYACKGAQLLARPILGDAVMSRALNGCVEVIIRDGEVWGERHRFDNRLTMAALTRLDQQGLTADPEAGVARLVAGGFDEYVEAVIAGGAAAGDFLIARAKAEGAWGPDQDAALLAAAEAHCATVVKARDASHGNGDVSEVIPDSDAVSEG
jgi:hypothetical protein